MGKYPVYQSPDLDQVEARMRPSPDFRHGYLGRDQRRLIQILTAGEARVRALGLSHEAIADRLDQLTLGAQSGYGETVLLEQKYIVTATVARGKIPCPWDHPGLYRKTHIDLRRTDSDDRLVWTDLSIHLIREHGFYQGEGSPYRLDPEAIHRVLFR
ncbi:MAG: hypothetical protein AUK55_13965 [Syntrophobacteraceae bacterium CG2_30_61_12]|nr:MAG: hypothetical protein AUK55_13965 [Syntrophobacteraceae bacterium CG2_30_61_12]